MVSDFIFARYCTQFKVNRKKVNCIPFVVVARLRMSYVRNSNFFEQFISEKNYSILTAIFYDIPFHSDVIEYSLSIKELKA